MQITAELFKMVSVLKTSYADSDTIPQHILLETLQLLSYGFYKTAGSVRSNSVSKIKRNKKRKRD